MRHLFLFISASADCRCARSASRGARSRLRFDGADVALRRRPLRQPDGVLRRGGCPLQFGEAVAAAVGEGAQVVAARQPF